MRERDRSKSVQMDPDVDIAFLVLYNAIESRAKGGWWAAPGSRRCVCALPSVAGRCFVIDSPDSARSPSVALN